MCLTIPKGTRISRWWKFCKNQIWLSYNNLKVLEFLLRVSKNLLRKYWWMYRTFTSLLHVRNVAYKLWTSSLRLAASHNQRHGRKSGFGGNYSSHTWQVFERVLLSVSAKMLTLNKLPCQRFPLLCKEFPF